MTSNCPMCESAAAGGSAARPRIGSISFASTMAATPPTMSVLTMALPSSTTLRTENMRFRPPNKLSLCHWGATAPNVKIQPLTSSGAASATMTSRIR